MELLIITVTVVWWIAGTIATIASKNVMLEETHTAGNVSSTVTAFSDFRWVDLTALQHLVGAIGSVLWLKLSSSEYMRITQENRRFVIIASVGNVVGNLATNAAYSLVSSSMTQIIKACEPLFMSLMLVCLWKEKVPSIPGILSLVLMVAGACIFMRSDNTFNILGVCASVLSNVAFPLRNIYLKRVDSNSVQKYATISIAGVAFLSPFILIKMLVTRSLPTAVNPDGCVSSAFHFVYNAASITVLGCVSPVTHAILNLNKRIIVISSNIVYFSTVFTLNMGVGLAAYIIGYSIHIFVGYPQNVVDYWRKYRKYILAVTATVCVSIALYFRDNGKAQELVGPQVSDDIILVNEEEPMFLDKVTLDMSPEQNYNCAETLRTSWVYASPIPEHIAKNIEAISNEHPGLKVWVYCGNTQCMNRFNDSKIISVQFLVVNTITKGTPLEDWVIRLPINKVVLRDSFETKLQLAVQLALLWRYGGIYLDPHLSVQARDFPDCDTFWLTNVHNKSATFQMEMVDFSRFPKHHPFIGALMQTFVDHYNVPVRDYTCKQLPPVLEHQNIQDTFDNICNHENRRDDCPPTLVIRMNKLPTVKYTDHFGTLTYDSHSVGIPFVNVGNEMQGFPGMQFLPFVDRFLDTDELAKSEGTENITSFFNAWWGPGDWPPPANIRPIWLSMHIRPRMQDIMSKNISYLRANAPIGCRDTDTLEFFQSINVKSFFSGCLTLMSKNPYHGLSRTDNIYLVDLAPSTRALLPPEIVQRAIRISHSCKLTTEDHYECISSYMSAYDRLEMYARAKLVITQRIHAALPSVAMGTPVLFINKDSMPGGGGTEEKPSPRVTGLTQLFQTLDLYEIRNVTAAQQWLRDFSWDEVPPNPNGHVVKRLRATFWNVIRKHQSLYDSARKFGYLPLTAPAPDTHDDLLFHLFIPSSFMEAVTKHNLGTLDQLHWRALESVLRHHPASRVRLYSDHIQQENFDVLTESGYKVEVCRYDVTGLALDAGLEQYMQTGTKSLPRKNLLFKLAVLHRYGGVCLDTDTFLLRPLDELPSSAVIQQENSEVINTGLMKFEAGHSFLQEAFKIISSQDARTESDESYLLTYAWNEWNNEIDDINVMSDGVMYVVDHGNQCFVGESELVLESTKMELQDKYAVQLSGVENLLVDELSVNGQLQVHSICKFLLNEYCILCNIMY